MAGEYLGDAQHNFQTRICDAWPTESFLELAGKARLNAEHDDEGLLWGLVAALIEAGDVLAAEVDRLDANKISA
jgi:hypothetical protein